MNKDDLLKSDIKKTKIMRKIGIVCSCICAVMALFCVFTGDPLYIFYSFIFLLNLSSVWASGKMLAILNSMTQLSEADLQRKKIDELYGRD